MLTSQTAQSHTTAKLSDASKAALTATIIIITTKTTDSKTTNETAEHIHRKRKKYVYVYSTKLQSIHTKIQLRYFICWRNDCTFANLRTEYLIWH